MRFSPNHQMHILREEEFDQEIQQIVRRLDQCRELGFFEGFDGAQLFYEYFLAEQSRGAVIIVHGLSEFTQKYYEFAYYLLNQGYDVFLYDQRGHGRSCRLTDRVDMIHVDKFTDYMEDLDRFVCSVVRTITDVPLYLYAHSMGGAVAALYLAKHPTVFRKAVLSAPMIEPLTSKASAGFARVGLGLYLAFTDKKNKFWQANEFDPNYKYEYSNDKSRARFERNMHIRRAEPCYRTTPITIGWAYQSVRLRPLLTKRSFLRQIQTPILMLCAEKDKVVDGCAQEEFAEKCSVCQRVVLKGATHAMLSGSHKTITEHVQHVLDYFC